RFRQLQARVQRGEAISRAEYEEEVGKLAVQDRNGTLWEINPRTGKWMYFDGAEWVSGAPPGHENSTVIPVPKEILAARETPTASAPPAPAPTAPHPTAPAPVAPSAPPQFVRTAHKPPARQKPPAAPPRTAPPGENLARPGPLGGRNREWVPLAIGAVVLLFCGVIVLVGGNFALNQFGPKPSPTRAVALVSPTLTRVPTAMMLPSPTPIPPTPVPVTAKVTATTLNIRAEASSKSQRVGILKKDNQVTFLAQTKGEKIEGQDTWYLINLPNSAQQGWVFFGKNFTMLSGDPNTLPVGGAAAPPAPVGTAATPTVIGVIPPAPKTYP
ncbi:MAG: SH3 domain-containing protein, partial [Chloroflexota bacterium]